MDGTDADELSSAPTGAFFGIPEGGHGHSTRGPGWAFPSLAVELSDGPLVKGYVRYVSADTDPARRDLVLQGPMTWAGPGEIPRTASSATFVFVPGALVRVVHISYPSEPATGPDVPRRSRPCAGTA
ncbi:DUF6338 family protein [Streptomyces hawaiiensis]|uniref:Uncharacterized protein n=1 Tax=Streptomyces hawaiiensis TaxID=67305 RepID=A0A6G5RH70_9ACTN|nr:DUF6338 family protein [Streptomyces hawaiiensis]QCD57106.1 hypothetical protein CEB94_21340 [Streptomyces hawaiiensis]